MYQPKRLILLLFLLAPFSANAVIISGTGGTGSDATLAGGTLIDFESTAPGQYASITINDVTFTDPGGDEFDIDGDYAGNFNTRGTQSMSNDFDQFPDQFRFDFAAPVRAFGFNWGASDNDWTMDVYDGTDSLLETHTLTKVRRSNAGDYFGAGTDTVGTSISYVILTDLKDRRPLGDYVFIDDFRYVFPDPDDPIVIPEPDIPDEPVIIDPSIPPLPGRITPIPEPGIIALFGLGLAGLGFARRRKA